jgi:hypothetical protein
MATGISASIDGIMRTMWKISSGAKLPSPSAWLNKAIFVDFIQL